MGNLHKYFVDSESVNIRSLILNDLNSILENPALLEEKVEVNKLDSIICGILAAGYKYGEHIAGISVDITYFYCASRDGICWNFPVEDIQKTIYMQILCRKRVVSEWY